MGDNVGSSHKRIKQFLGNAYASGPPRRPHDEMRLVAHRSLKRFNNYYKIPEELLELQRSKKTTSRFGKIKRRT